MIFKAFNFRTAEPFRTGGWRWWQNENEMRRANKFIVVIDASVTTVTTVTTNSLTSTKSR